MSKISTRSSTSGWGPATKCAWLIRALGAMNPFRVEFREAHPPEMRRHGRRRGRARDPAQEALPGKQHPGADPGALEEPDDQSPQIPYLIEPTTRPAAQLASQSQRGARLPAGQLRQPADHPDAGCEGPAAVRAAGMPSGRNSCRARRCTRPTAAPAGTWRACWAAAGHARPHPGQNAAAPRHAAGASRNPHPRRPASSHQNRRAARAVPGAALWSNRNRADRGDTYIAAGPRSGGSSAPLPPD